MLVSRRQARQSRQEERTKANGKERDEALNLVQPVRAQRMPEIVERYRSRISARHEEAVEAEARLFADLLAEVEKVVTEPPSIHRA